MALIVCKGQGEVIVPMSMACRPQLIAFQYNGQELSKEVDDKPTWPYFWTTEDDCDISEEGR